jgi:UDPglucose 6-dehydrogenase
MKITVVGAGYVGLVTGACLSSTGNEVTVVDISDERIGMLCSGVVPIYEPGLDQLIAKNHAEGRLQFSTDIAAAVGRSSIVYLAVGTPSRSDGSADLSWIDAAAKGVGQAIRQYTVVVTKSTVPVGTYQRITDIIRAETDVEFDYVSNPEFLREGTAIGDFMKPDRIILGSRSARAQKTMHNLYAPYVRRDDRVIIMDPASAELTKYACNAMLAARISFMNDLSRLCHEVGADVTLLRHGMGTDKRIGPDFLYASLGYGGSCFPKDIRALIQMGQEVNTSLGVVQAVHEANVRQHNWMVEQVLEALGGDVEGKRLAIWGLAFKAGTDDVRESPALHVVEALLSKGAILTVFDPKAMETARAQLGSRVRYADSMYGALEGATALVICTEWLTFRSPDFVRMRSLMTGTSIIDGRNLYDLDWIADTGLDYHSVGRPDIVQD